MGRVCLLEPNSSASSETWASSLPKGCSGVSGLGLNMLTDDRMEMLLWWDMLLLWEILLLCEAVLLWALARPGVAVLGVAVLVVGDWKPVVETDRFLNEMLLLGVAIRDMERLRATTSECFLVCEGARWGILGTSM